MHQRRFIRLLLLVALNLVIFLCFAWSTTVSQQPVALAHAFVIGSEPVDGSTVKAVRLGDRELRCDLPEECQNRGSGARR